MRYEWEFDQTPAPPGSSPDRFLARLNQRQQALGGNVKAIRQSVINDLEKCSPMPLTPFENRFQWPTK